MNLAGLVDAENQCPWPGILGMYQVPYHRDGRCESSSTYTRYGARALSEKMKFRAYFRMWRCCFPSTQSCCGRLRNGCTNGRPPDMQTKLIALFATDTQKCSPAPISQKLTKDPTPASANKEGRSITSFFPSTQAKYARALATPKLERKLQTDASMSPKFEEVAMCQPKKRHTAEHPKAVKKKRAMRWRGFVQRCPQNNLDRKAKIYKTAKIVNVVAPVISMRMNNTRPSSMSPRREQVLSSRHLAFSRCFWGKDSIPFLEGSAGRVHNTFQNIWNNNKFKSSWVQECSRNAHSPPPSSIEVFLSLHLSSGYLPLAWLFIIIIIPLAFVACDTVVMNVGGTTKAGRYLRWRQ